MTADPTPARVAADRGRTERREADRWHPSATQPVETVPPVSAPTPDGQTGTQGREEATERLMLALLRQRYTRVSMGAHRYAFAEHVPNRPGFAQRIADFMAIDCYASGPWEARRHEIHGHEIKVSRSDWLAELRDPEKAEAFRPYCHRWWLVVADHSIVRPGELPEGWGLLARAGGVLRATKAAPLLTPEPMPPGLFASMLRATAKTAAAETRELVSS